MNSLFDNDAEPESAPEKPVNFAGSYETADETVATTPEPAIDVVPFEPISEGEAIKRQGIAWTMGLAFFGSVVFMLLLGWFADLLFGSSPWGIVIGIAIGSLMGFVQFFRLSSGMYKK